MSATGYSSWPTPAAADSERSTDSYERRNRRTVERIGAEGGDMTLPSKVELWATPTTQDSENDAAPSQLQRNSDALNVQASLWASPMASEARQGYQRRPAGMASEQNQESLSTQAATWRTPRAPGPASGGPSVTRLDSEHPYMDLQDQVATWPTPTTSDGGVESSRVHGDKLATRLGQFAPSRPDPAPGPNGQPSSPPGRTSRPRLNPRFVEWLMGWPEGWSTASIACGCSETESFLSVQRWHLQRLLGGRD